MAVWIGACRKVLLCTNLLYALGFREERARQVKRKSQRRSKEGGSAKLEPRNC